MIMPPRLRKVALVLHITVSVGWVGAVAAYLPLDVTASTSQDPQTLRAAYISMELVAQRAIVPLAWATLATGLLMSLGTKWGLFRHYWVIFSFILTVFAVAVLMTEMRAINAYGSLAANPETSDATLRALGGTLLHSVLGTVVLVIVLVMNMYKPRGMTRYGWRKKQDGRSEAT
ncbi:MAG: DUF2269 domain-containing protein [Gemmatimonadales bacterium]